MELTNLQIRDFQILYENKFGIILTKEETIVTANKLIALLKPIILPNNETTFKN